MTFRANILKPHLTKKLSFFYTKYEEVVDQMGGGGGVKQKGQSAPRPPPPLDRGTNESFKIKRSVQICLFVNFHVHMEEQDLAQGLRLLRHRN